MFDEIFDFRTCMYTHSKIKQPEPYSISTLDHETYMASILTSTMYAAPLGKSTSIIKTIFSPLKFLLN